MSNITLITGGARSGKSSFALQLANETAGKRAYIATATALDKEMEERIALHQKEREDKFVTIEEQIDLEKALQSCSQGIDIIIVDCLTIWLGNLFFHFKDNEQEVKKHVKGFLTFISNTSLCDLVIVTNEVGSGIIPENKTTRSYRDIAGYLNASMAKIADSVYHCVCGIPQKIK
jgi:adenosylcobinamide kinase/adenosylcobinamide-phosphate guanylyltransferase